MPRTKGSENRPKTNITKDYSSQIIEKQETSASLKTEIISITVNIDILKAEAENEVKKLLASGMSTDEIHEKLK